MTNTELKALRKHLGLSLAQASRQVGVTPSTWCRWEVGDTPLPYAEIKLFKLLNKVKEK